MRWSQSWNLRCLEGSCHIQMPRWQMLAGIQGKRDAALGRAITGEGKSLIIGLREELWPSDIGNMSN